MDCITSFVTQPDCIKGYHWLIHCATQFITWVVSLVTGKIAVNIVIIFTLVEVLICNRWTFSTVRVSSSICVSRVHGFRFNDITCCRKFIFLE